ncbi:hypothetical protein [Nocardioides zhouii]|uniref:Uncharacterized protein n=1 Tax=Nocardioides zhouii TaxID=1168729 RepID=A0A4Q2T080_9ACTN|nr:hypothetical protein [Nocardioides zhouii]RYC11251.1 hypothetical protein EUA94_09765 [Nocardioides zhouii]
MAPSALTHDDLEWALDVLARRRQALVPHAPAFWRPAPDALDRHRDHLDHLLSAGARGFRTAGSVLLAAPRGDGWLVDDAAVEGAAPASEWQHLWDAFADACPGDAVRLVCPTYDAERAEHATRVGLNVAESWWLRELPGSGGGQSGIDVALPGADAVTVGAPPVYAPPGPILFLPTVKDVAALPAALTRAPELGCVAIVVAQRAGHQDLADDLSACGFRRHCDYYEGRIAPT